MDKVHEHFLRNWSQVNAGEHIWCKSRSVQVMAWFRQATSQYLCWCWPRSVSLLGHFVYNIFKCMMTSSNGKIFRVTGLCAGNSPVTGEFLAQRPVTRSFDAFFDLRLNKQLNKQSWGWWFETLSCSLWRHCNVYIVEWKVLCLDYNFTEICPTGNWFALIWIMASCH